MRHVVPSADGPNQWHHQNNLWANWHSPKKMLAQSKSHNKVRLEKLNFLTCNISMLYVEIKLEQNWGTQMRYSQG